MTGISLRNSQVLGHTNACVKRATSFHRFEDHVSRRVENARESAELDQRQRFPKQGKYRSAVQYRRLKAILSFLCSCDLLQFIICVDDRSFIGADCMSPGFKYGL